MRLYNICYGSNLIEHNNKIYLFDTGTEKRARNIILPFLYAYFPNIYGIEAIFISHYHNNHTGGVPLLINNFNVKHIYSNGTYSDDPSPSYANDPIVEQEIQDLVNQKNIPYTFYKSGDNLSFDGFNMSVWSPLQKYFTNGGRTTDPNGPTSGVLKLEYGDFSAVFGGDLNRPSYVEEVWNSVGNVKTNIFFWPHHGDPNTAKDSLILPMQLDLAIIETLRSSSETVNYLKSRDIDFMWSKSSTYSAVKAYSDGTFDKIENVPEFINKPKGKVFMN